ncbi:hypothetical protein ACWKSR_12950, partial [Campylobacter fetus subsp. venerealis]
GIHYVTGIGGLNVINFSFKPNAATFFVSMDPWDERKDPSLQLEGMLATLNRKFAAITEGSIVVVPPPAIPGLGSTGGF